MPAKKKPVAKKTTAKKKPVTKKTIAKKKLVAKKTTAKKKPVAKKPSAKKVTNKLPCIHSAGFDVRVFPHISRLRCLSCGTTWLTSSTNSGDLAQLKRTILYTARYEQHSARYTLLKWNIPRDTQEAV